MAEYHEIVGMGDTNVSASGNAVRFILETKDGADIPLACATQGLEILVATLTSLHQEAAEKQRKAPAGERHIDLVRVSQIGCAPSENTLDVVLALTLATGTSLNVALHPELAKDLAEQLPPLASAQLAKKN